MQASRYKVNKWRLRGVRSKNKTKIFAFFSSFLPSYPHTHNHRNTQEEMNFRNQVCRGTHAPCSLLLCLAHVGRTHLAFQTGTIYTPPSPQRCEPLPISSPPCLPGFGGEETPMSSGAGSGCPQQHFLLPSHQTNPSPPNTVFTFPAAAFPDAQMWPVQEGTYFVGAPHSQQLSQSSSALSSLVPGLQPSPWQLPAPGDSQPRQTIPGEGTWAGGILLISKPCSKKGAGNSIQGRKGVSPGNTDKGGCEIGAEKKQNHSFIFPCKS